MLTTRIIPCLDVDNGRVVKGVNFVNLIDAGDPVEIAAKYYDMGADEITFLDITASCDNRNTMVDMVSNVAEQVFIPLTVGGGVRNLQDIKKILRAGADKVSINTAAITTPTLIKEAVDHFGTQCIVVAIDARKVGENRWEVYTHGGRNPTGIDALEWAKKMAHFGAGELLVTSMDRDGTKQGFDLELYMEISKNVPIPLIASGGVGSLQHLVDGAKIGLADAVLAASIFHFGQHTISEAKQVMHDNGIPIRQ